MNRSKFLTSVAIALAFSINYCVTLPASAQPVPAESVGLFFSVFDGSGNQHRNALNIQKQGGWDGWIKEYVEPAVTWAEKGDRPVWINIHNPFGTIVDDIKTPLVNEGESMQPDQFLEAQEAGLDWLKDDFIEAWSAFRERHPTVRVCMYIGKWSADLTTRALIRTDKLAEAEDRRERSMAPLMAVSDWIGLDALSASPTGGVDQLSVAWIQSQGVGVIGEWSPDADKWQVDLPSMILYERIESVHSPDRGERDWKKDIPTWDEAAWPLYLRSGRAVILKAPRVKWDRPDKMKAAVADVSEHGFIPLIQPSPEVLKVPIGWYFEGVKMGVDQ